MSESSRQILERLRYRADDNGRVRAETFVEAALYEPGLGYYVRQKRRVGQREGTDFTTAATLQPTFGHLMAAAARTLLGGAEPGACPFVDYGAEAGNPIPNVAPLDYVPVERGSELPRFPRQVLFANELLDAQPFVRLRAQAGQWREVLLDLRAKPPTEVLAEESPPPRVRDFIAALPRPPGEGYTLDYSLRAEELLADAVSRWWSGVVILVDYGLTFEELTTLRPHGTGRAYRNHQLGAELWHDPGEQDLTTHLCWERLEAILRGSGFGEVRVERLEAFLMRAAREVIEGILSEGEATDPSRRQLMQLLHPGGYGSKFEVLSGVR